MTLLSAAIRKDTADRYHEVIRADLVVESSGMEMLGGLSPEAYDRIAALPDVDVATRMRFGHFKTGSSTTALSAVEPGRIGDALRAEVAAVWQRFEQVSRDHEADDPDLRTAHYVWSLLELLAMALILEFRVADCQYLFPRRITSRLPGTC